MDRRAFLSGSLQGLAALFVAGCGGGGGSTGPGGATSSVSSQPSLVARVSDSVIFAFDGASVMELEPYGYRVTRRSGQGQVQWVLGGSPDDFNCPLAADVGTDGRLYLLAEGSSEVHVLDPSGMRQGRFGSFGFGDANLAYPSDLAIDPSGTEIYVADSLNHRIQVFGLAGQPLRRFRLGGQQWVHSVPRGLAFDSEGRLHVADAGFGQVLVVDAYGAEIARYGAPGTALGQFTLPRSIAIDASGTRYVADSMAARVTLFDPDNQVVSDFVPARLDGSAAPPLHVAVGPDQRLYLHVS